MAAARTACLGALSGLLGERSNRTGTCRLTQAMTVIACIAIFSCATPHVFGRPSISTSGERACGPALFVFEDGVFDGYSLPGKLFVGAKGASLWVHPLSVAPYTFSVSKIFACGSSDPLPLYIVDVVGGCDSEADCALFKLRPGFLYGTREVFPLGLEPLR